MQLPVRSALLIVTAALCAPPVPLAEGAGGACPTTGACHLTPWAPAGLPEAAHLGLAVDLQGDTAAVGAPQEDAVYIYGLQGGQWSQVQRIASPGGGGLDFGHALRLDGDELLVGAPLADVVDEKGYHFRAGLAYLFERDAGGGWSLADTLGFSFPTSYGRFGTSVDKQGDRIAVGSPGAWYTDVGAVAVFDRDGAGWSESAALTPPDTVGLGSAVALDGDRVLGGDDVNDALGDYAGRIYAWRDTGAGFGAPEVLPSPGIGPSSYLGWCLSTHDGWLAAGAYGAGTGGAVLAYRWDEGAAAYQHAQTLTSCGGEAGGRFGHAVDLDAGRLAVGATLEVWPGPSTGRTHVYRLETVPAESWELELVVQPEGAGAWDAFGRSVAVDGEQVLVGASDADATAWGSGAAYLVSLQNELAPGGACPCDTLAGAEVFGSGKPGSAGVPQLELLSAPVLGGVTPLRLSAALPGALPWTLWGFTPAAIPFDGGTLFVADPHALAMPAVSPAGEALSALGGAGGPGPVRGRDRAPGRLRRSRRRRALPDGPDAGAAGPVRLLVPEQARRRWFWDSSSARRKAGRQRSLPSRNANEVSMFRAVRNADGASNGIWTAPTAGSAALA